MKKSLKKDEQPQLLRKVCHIIAKAIAAEMSRKTERKWFVSSLSSTTNSTPIRHKNTAMGYTYSPIQYYAPTCGHTFFGDFYDTTNAGVKLNTHPRVRHAALISRKHANHSTDGREGLEQDPYVGIGEKAQVSKY